MALLKTFCSSCIHVLVLVSLTRGRDVPANTDLCRRFPTSSFCRRTDRPAAAVQSFQPRPSSTLPARVPTAGGAANSNANRAPPPTSPRSAPAASAPGKLPDKDTYCSQYRVHYQYFCLGNGKGNPKAAEFCPSYKADCDTEAQQGFVPATQELHPCYEYRNQFAAVCLQQQPATPQAVQFCQTYSDTCSNQAAPGPQLQPQPQSRPVQPLVQPMPQVPLQPAPSPIQQVPQQVPIQQPLPQQPAPALPQQPAGSPLTVGSGTSVGNFANVGSQTAVNPFSGVNTGRSVGAGPVGVSSGTGVGFGGLPGLSSLGSSPMGGLFGRRRRRRVTATSDLLWNKLVY